QRSYQKCIDRCAYSVFGFGFWDWRPVNWLKRPEGALFLSDAIALSWFGWFRPRCLRACHDPLLDQGHLFRSELLIALRHFAAGNELQKQTPIGLARNDHRAVVPAVEHQMAQAQVEAALELVAFTVAFKAMRFENRADVLLEH